MAESNLDKFPFVAVPDALHECVVGWDKIAAELQRAIAKHRAEKPILVVDCYPGVDELAALNELQSRLTPKLTIHAADAYHSPEKIDKLVAPFLGRKDPAFGHASNLSLVNFFNAEPLWRFRRTIDELKGGLVLIVGCGASLIAWGHLLVYADLARREARERLHRNESGNLGADNKSVSIDAKHKRALLVDWPVSDRWKRPLIKRWDYVLDTNNFSEPKLADAEDVRRGFHAAARQPFRVSADSLEENSLLLGFGDHRFELPAIDLLYNQPHALLGEDVHARFGVHFPIQLDFLAKENALIEIRRHRFSKTVAHHARGGVNVLKLVEGDEAVVESLDGAFEPLVVHHGETFIVPAAVGRYKIRPHGPSAGKEIATIKAFVGT